MNTNTLKKFGTALVVVQLLSSGAFAVSLIDETLETDGNGSRYYANEFGGDLDRDYSHRTSTVNGEQTETNSSIGIDPSYILEADNGSWFWNMRDMDGTGGNPEPFRTADQGLVRFVSTDLSAFTFEKLNVSIDLAIGSYADQYDSGLTGQQDSFDIQYSFDNALANPFGITPDDLSSDFANFTSFAKFVGNNQTRKGSSVDPTGNFTPGSSGVDNGDGVGFKGVAGTRTDGMIMTAGAVDTAGFIDPAKVEDIPFRTFNFTLDLAAISASSVTFQLLTTMHGSFEIFAWDNFKVEGIEASTPPPSNVPDSSATGILLGSALFGLFACRRFKRS